MKPKLAHGGRDSSRLVVFFFLFLFFVGEPVGMSGAASQEKEHDEALKEQFLQEAPERWGAYSQRAAQLQGRVSFRLSQVLDNLKAMELIELKKGTGGRELLQSTYENASEGKGAEKILKVYGLNPDYGFALRREDPSSPWVLTGLVVGQGESLSELKSKHIDEVNYDYVNQLVKVYRERLVDMVQRPEFRVTGCRRVQGSGEELAEVTFDYPHEVRAGGNPVQGGTLLLDPRRFWCLRSYDVRMKSAAGQGRIKYQVVKWKEVDGLPVPEQTVRDTEAVYNNLKNEQKWHFEFDLGLPDRLPPDGDFTLSAFGLPEPEGLGRGRRIPWYLLAGGLGVVCLGLAVLLRWRAGRAEQGAQ